jgi:hypothetical protein
LAITNLALAIGAGKRSGESRVKVNQPEPF